MNERDAEIEHVGMAGSVAELARPGRHAAVATVPVYKAISDEAGGEIEVKAVNLDGSVTGQTLTLKVLP